ncbi:MAG: Gfo/Idh/MocA family oxidoreductase [Eubacterium sp.]|nr:Gfo/Idh/MocA family oxidoreductase [Eubacterium sp.]
MKIGFGIIGFGYVGHKHELKIMETEGAELIAICDVVPERMDDAASANVRKYTDAEELLKLEEIDTVVISIENHLHKDMVIRAASAGKNIICEKPVGLNVQELDEMEAACKEHGVIFTVHQQRRYDRDYRIIKEVYDSGELGDIYTIQSKLCGFNGNMHDWHVYKKYGGGMLYDWGVHLIDQILWMVPAKLCSIYADVRNVINFEVDDYFKLIFKFENHVTAEIELGTYLLTDKPNWFEHHWFMGGNKGSVYSDGFNPQGKIVKTTRLLTNTPGETTMTFAGPTRSFGALPEGVVYTEELPNVQSEQIMFYHNYMKARAGEEELLVKIPEMRRVLRVLAAVWESANENKVVMFEDN